MIEAMRIVLTTALILTVVPVTLHGQARPDTAHPSLATSSNTRSLDPQHVTKADSSAGAHRHVGLGLVLGVLTGTIVGIAIESGGPHGEARELNQLRGAIGGASFGTITGATVGFFWRTEK